MAKIEYTTESGDKYIVEVADCGETLGEIVDFVVKPLFLAAGFHPDTINEYIGGYDE